MAPGTGAPLALRTVPSIARFVELLRGPMERLELSGAVSGGGICGATCQARATGSIEANTAAALETSATLLRLLFLPLRLRRLHPRRNRSLRSLHPSRLPRQAPRD